MTGFAADVEAEDGENEDRDGEQIEGACGDQKPLDGGDEKYGGRGEGQPTGEGWGLLWDGSVLRGGSGCVFEEQLVEEKTKGKEQRREVVEEEVIADQKACKNGAGEGGWASGCPGEDGEGGEEGEEGGEARAAREREEESIEVWHLGGEDCEVCLERPVGGNGRGHLEDGGEVGEETVRTDDGGGEGGQDGCPSKEAGEEAKLSPEEEEEGDGKGDLELNERQREKDACEDGPAATEGLEAEAEEQEDDERELAHEDGDAGWEEAEPERVGGEWQAGPEGVKVGGDACSRKEKESEVEQKKGDVSGVER